MDKVITILIPTYNRAKSLQAVWPSYFNSPNVKEIIIVNDGSTDDTGTVVRALSEASLIPVRLIEHPRKMGQQYSRHTAINAATTEWVLFGEDDVWLDEGYCETLLREAYKLKADAIAGRLLTAYIPDKFDIKLLVDNRLNSSSNICAMDEFIGHFDACPPSPIPVAFLHSIALIRKKLFTQVGFDTWYKGNAHREETDFYLVLNSLGYKVYFTPNACCFHLRGPICASGGQRINRIILEYWHFINTCHMVAKNWRYLESKHEFHGSVLHWMIKYFIVRQYKQILRIFSGNVRSSFKGNK